MKSKPQFISIDHQSSRASISGLTVDVSQVVAAIQELGRKVEALSLKMPEPHVVEISPIIHMPTQEAPAVNVSLPEMSPRIEVNPPEVVIQKSDGSIVSQVIQVKMPWLAVVAMGAVPVVVMVVDILMRRF